MKPLAVFTTIRNAYAFVWQGHRDFLSLALPAVVVLAVVWTLIAWIEIPATPTKAEDANGLGDLIYSVISLAVWVMFAVAWHRRYLVPGEATTIRAALRWRRRQTRFLLLAIGVGVLAILVLLVTSVVAGLFGTLFNGVWQMLLLAIVIAWVPVLLIYARLSLLFPSTAVDHLMSFRECWRFTRGNGWRLALIIFLIGAPVFVIAVLIQLAVAHILGFLEITESVATSFVAAFVVEAVWFVGIAAGVSALSISYRTLMVAPPDTLPAEA